MDIVLNSIANIFNPLKGLKISNEEYLQLLREYEKGYKELEKLNHLCVCMDVLKCTTYNNINDIMKIIANDNDNHIYIYVEDVDKYVVFRDQHEFGKFMNFALPEFINLPIDAVNRGDIQKYQIITTNSQQKLTLSYVGSREAEANKIREEAIKYFGTQVRIDENPRWRSNQIVIEKSINKHSEGVDQYVEFCKHLEKVEKGLGDGLRVAPVDTHMSGVQYTMPIIKYNGNGLCVDDFEKSLIANAKYVSITNIINNINIGNNNNNINIGCAYGVNQSGNNRSIDWIISHPPEIRERTSVYYDRYVTEIRKNSLLPLSIQKVAKQVEKMGFKNIKGTDAKHYWVRV